MTENEAIIELKKMYENAPYRDQVTMIHLFGIKYATELKDLHIRTIAVRATGKASYVTEINKGIRLAKYVILRS